MSKPAPTTKAAQVDATQSVAPSTDKKSKSALPKTLDFLFAAADYNCNAAVVALKNYALAGGKGPEEAASRKAAVQQSLMSCLNAQNQLIPLSIDYDLAAEQQATLKRVSDTIRSLGNAISRDHTIPKDNPITIVPSMAEAGIPEAKKPRGQFVTEVDVANADACAEDMVDKDSACFLTDKKRTITHGRCEERLDEIVTEVNRVIEAINLSATKTSPTLLSTVIDITISMLTAGVGIPIKNALSLAKKAVTTKMIETGIDKGLAVAGRSLAPSKSKPAELPSDTIARAVSAWRAATVDELLSRADDDRLLHYEQVLKSAVASNIGAKIRTAVARWKSEIAPVGGSVNVGGIPMMKRYIAKVSWRGETRLAQCEGVILGQPEMGGLKFGDSHFRYWISKGMENAATTIHAEMFGASPIVRNAEDIEPDERGELRGWMTELDIASADPKIAAFGRARANLQDAFGENGASLF